MLVKELIASCLQHNRLSEQRLYDHYVTIMARLCLRYIKDTAEVQDVLIEGFVKVFDKLHTFEYRGEHSLEVWIRRIMINECLMRLRKNNQHISGLEEVNEPADVTSETNEILMLMRHLPPGYRTILNLYVIDGYSHKEISDICRSILFQESFLIPWRSDGDIAKQR